MFCLVFSRRKVRWPLTVIRRQPAKAHTLEQLRGLRSGEQRTIGFRDAEGLIAFPSFHTIWAILLALAFRHRRRLFVVAVALNLVVILSTLTTGWHYLSDVLGGGLVVGLVAFSWNAS